ETGKLLSAYVFLLGEYHQMSAIIRVTWRKELQCIQDQFRTVELESGLTNSGHHRNTFHREK
ncbi:hypothetical protein RUM43_012994, partial [Polyplax serrata]